MRVLVTGAAGFAGHHIVEHILRNTSWDVLALDRLTYAGDLYRLAHLRCDRLAFLYHDFRSRFQGYKLKWLQGVDYVIHNGGETHVERSLRDAEPFVTSNVLGTMHVLNAACELGVKRFIYVSTDEVHGPAPQGVDHKEDAPIRPSNPYAATKAGGEALAYAWRRSYGLPVIITRTMNLFGERQHPEKFVPMTIRKVLKGERVTIHGTVDGSSGSRKWLHARNQASALLFLLEYGVPGETYHVAGEEHTNLEIAQKVATALGKRLDYEVLDFHSSRPGHDLRYSLDDSKLRGLGWEPPVAFEGSFERTVRWMVAHPEWLEG